MESIDPIAVTLMTGILLFGSGIITGIGYESWVRSEYIVEYRSWYPQNEMWSAWRTYSQSTYARKHQAEEMIDSLSRIGTSSPREYRVKKKTV